MNPLRSLRGQQPFKGLKQVSADWVVTREQMLICCSLLRSLANVDWLSDARRRLAALESELG